MLISKKDRLFLWILGTLSLLYIIPIILADVYYVDDLPRSLYGYGWISDGRLLTDYLYRILSFGSFILDISPLSQILGITTMVLCAFLIYKKFTQSYSLFAALCLAFLFIGSPFYLENLSYKYEAFMMSLSVLFAILAFLYVSSSRSFYKKNIASTFFLTLCFLSYQPAVPVFVGLNIFYLFNTVKNHEDTKIALKNIFSALVILAIAYLVYSVLSKPFLAGWGKLHNQVIFLTPEHLSVYFSHFYQAMRRFGTLFQDPWAVLIYGVPTVITFVYTLVVGFLKIKHSTKKPHNVVAGIICIFAVPLLFLAMLMMILPLTDPTYKPRIFIGFSVLSLFVFTGFVDVFNKIKWYRVHYLLVLPVLYCFSMVYVYGNVQKTQKRFEQQLALYIIEDLKSLNKITSIKSLLFLGEEPFSPEARLANTKRPYLKLLTPRYLAQFGANFALAYLNHFGILHLERVYIGEEEEIQSLLPLVSATPPLKSNNLYTLKIIKDCAVITYNP